ncbi:MAG TPA: DNA gyrase subunit A, partial [Phycisphaerales bacterium]|nr:DNA gyrase subunit A [Phycisphaerales bacterium]
YNVPQLTRQSKGRSIANLLDMGDQKIASIINVSKFDERNLVMATKNGVIKKSALSLYSNPRPSGIIAVKLDPDDDLIGVALTNGKNDIILGTKDGMAIRFDEEQARPMGRSAHGVKGISLRKGDYVVDMVVAEEGASLLTVCELGFGKRTELEDYRSQNRGGIGLINIKTSDRNGNVVAIKTVRHDDDIMIITAKGIIIRTGLDELRQIGRNTQGVRLIKLDEDDKVVAVERVLKEEKEESNGQETQPSKSPESENKTDTTNEQQ